MAPARCALRLEDMLGWPTIFWVQEFLESKELKMNYNFQKILLVQQSKNTFVLNLNKSAFGKEIKLEYKLF
jgi:hypothetical protein